MCMCVCVCVCVCVQSVLILLQYHHVKDFFSLCLLIAIPPVSSKACIGRQASNQRRAHVFSGSWIFHLTSPMLPATLFLTQRHKEIYGFINKFLCASRSGGGGGGRTFFTYAFGPSPASLDVNKTPGDFELSYSC